VQQPPPPPPLAPPPPQGYVQPPVRRRRWWLWGCGGCAVLAAIVIGILLATGLAGFIGIFTGSPLRQFPTEAGASTVNESIESGPSGTTETMVIDDPHSLTQVETYYQSALSTGSWSVDSADPSQATSGDTWHFNHSGSGNHTGAIQFVTASGGTQITVQYSS
jgi:hypothetical protein